MLTLGQMPSITIVLGMGVGEKTRAQEHRVLAVFLAQRVHALVKVRQPLQPDHFPKQIELAIIRLRELAQDDACCAIESSELKEAIKRRRHDMENIVRETGRSGEVHLQPLVMEILRP